MGMVDYRKLGILAALDVINAVVPNQKVHAVGYCLGGTLLSLTAAAMARDGDERLASMSLFAAQVDFTEPGELDLFIDESQITYLEDNMWQKGYLDAYQMAGAFQLLRSNDLIWSAVVKDYLMGERTPILISWPGMPMLPACPTECTANTSAVYSLIMISSKGVTMSKGSPFISAIFERRFCSWHR
ncbi:hypothetical protein [Alkalilimnicola ehrlichii]|uniref:hypothetical protein n=1 Tax=Alkalilimnicola ehrlichii TaxID=351052 RepID=UPI002163F4BA|nr:hypothetical protein [Alkalilimnicola ehrlichii]